MDIMALLQFLQPILNATTIRQLSRIVFALFAMTGRVTMLGISRWAGTGGSYCTIQRWFYARIPWAQGFVHLFRQHLFQANATYILAGDEVVVTKAGHHTFRLDRFFSGLWQKVVPGLAFFALSLINTADQTSSPMAVEQVVRSKPVSVPTPTSVSPSSTSKGKPGRPRGSQNKNKMQVILTPELQQIQTMIQALLPKLTGWLSVTYVALDGLSWPKNLIRLGFDLYCYLFHPDYPISPLIAFDRNYEDGVISQDSLQKVHRSVTIGFRNLRHSRNHSLFIGQKLLTVVSQPVKRLSSLTAKEPSPL